jgi:hypothetical protein
MGKRSGRNSDNNRNPPKWQGKCDNCGKEGHWQIDCWSKGSGKEGQKPKDYGKYHGRRNQNENAKTATEANITDEHAFITVDFSLIATDKAEFGCILDSGASTHFEPDCGKYQIFWSIPPKPIKAMDGRIFYATGQGEVPFIIHNGTKTHKIMLKDTLYMPTMSIPLISIRHCKIWLPPNIWK